MLILMPMSPVLVIHADINAYVHSEVLGGEGVEPSRTQLCGMPAWGIQDCKGKLGMSHLPCWAHNQRHRPNRMHRM